MYIHNFFLTTYERRRLERDLTRRLRRGRTTVIEAGVPTGARQPSGAVREPQAPQLPPTMDQRNIYI